MACPEPARLQRLVDGGLAPAERGELARHTDTCDACRAAVAALFEAARGRTLGAIGSASTGHAAIANGSTWNADPATDSTVGTGGTTPAGPIAELAPGTRVDRYVIERRLGAGAMGVVHAARDPELDRPVAIKLLRRAGDDEALRTRLYREAQALARVDHANVVSVYDVGTHAGQVFVAMELIRGDTLRGWLARPRTVRETIAVLIAAGRGLAAAHAAQLVHRDFKPDNVLVGDDGIARVTDFGLARGTGADPENVADADDVARAGSASDQAAAAGSPLTSTLTVTGSLLGTPVYAAPEQLAGDRAGPLADQFSFCVTAYEACYGHRPFVAATLPELIAAIKAGTIKPPPPGRRVPGRIHRALLRGLAHDPEARFPSMTELLAELEPPRRRWPWVAVAAGVIAIPVVAVVALRAGPAAPARCRSADDRLATVWDRGRREAVITAFAGLPGYVESGPKIAAELDRYATTWRAGWTAACAAPEQSSTLFDRRIRCLDQRRGELGATVGALVAPDRATAEHAFELVTALPPAAECDDTDALTTELQPSPAQRDAVAAIELRLVEGTIALRTTRYDAARTAFEAAVAAARTAGFQPILSRALLGLGVLERVSDHLKEAEVALRESSKVAVAINNHRLVALTFLELGTIRVNQGDLEGAEETLDLASAAVAATGAGAAELEGQLLTTMAVLRSHQTRHAEAIAYLDRAITAIEREQPVDKLMLAGALTGKAQTLDMLGRRAEARTTFERAIAMYVEIAGPDHPNTAAAQALSALVLAGDHRYAEAMALVDRSYATLVRTLGPDDVSTTEVEDSLAAIAMELGRFDDALAHLEHIRKVAAAADPRSDRVTIARIGIGAVLTRMGKGAEAVEQLAAVRKDIGATVGDESAMAAFADLRLAQARIVAGEPAAAAAMLVEVDKRFVALLGADLPMRGEIRASLGRALLAAGKVREALDELRPAIALILTQGEPYDTASAQLALADALWRTDDKPAAREAAVRAIATLDELSPTASPLLRAEIEAWQRAHP